MEFGDDPLDADVLLYVHLKEKNPQNVKNTWSKNKLEQLKQRVSFFGIILCMKDSQKS